MNQDPNYQQELLKYPNPIPSRAFILDTIRRHQLTMNHQQLCRFFKIVDKPYQDALLRRLRAMEKSGQLIFTKRQYYALPETLPLTKGKVITLNDGTGAFAVVGEKHWLIPKREMNYLLDGDLIWAIEDGYDRKGRKIAKVIQIIDAFKKKIVGRFFYQSKMGFVIPNESKITKNIFIASENQLGARSGQMVVVELLSRQKSALLTGKIIEVLGDSLTLSLETERVIRHYDMPHIWPSAVEKETRQLSREVPAESKIGRVDLRELPLVTIDGESAKDFDDAVFCRAEAQGWKLWVAIADVSHYVRPKTALDLEAQLRGNSVYFPHRVIPMLPEVLSNGLCSLNPQVDRLCLVAEMTISQTGELTNYQFYEAVIHSHARLTYSEVWQILQGNEVFRQRYSMLVPYLETLKQLYDVLAIQRQLRGAIELETAETQFIFDYEGNVTGIESVVRNDAHKIIEECMIMANIAAARFIQTHHINMLYRVHEVPTDEKLKDFKTFLNERGINFDEGMPTPQNYAKLAERIKLRPDREFIQMMLLRSLKQAVYSAQNMGHFGLALMEYAHFTSPIRRYPDLLLHRAIKYLLTQKAIKQRYDSSNGGYSYTLAELVQLGEHCSQTERRADEATREVADWLKCDYMLNHIGEIFSGTISNVTGFGLFVKIDTLLIDGLVHISTLDNGYYYFDNARQRLVGKNGKIYRLGDKVNIKVMRVSVEEKKIDFELVRSSCESSSIKLPKKSKNRNGIFI